MTEDKTKMNCMGIGGKSPSFLMFADADRRNVIICISFFGKDDVQCTHFIKVMGLIMNASY